LDPSAVATLAGRRRAPSPSTCGQVITRPLTCPEARALELTPEQAAYAVDWANDLVLFTPDELAAYTTRMAGCGPMGQAAILEATYRVVKASR